MFNAWSSRRVEEDTSAKGTGNDCGYVGGFVIGEAGVGRGRAIPGQAKALCRMIW